MSDVKKISPVGSIHGWEESEFGEFVRSEDFEALEAEAQALREELKNRTAECNGLHEMLRQEHDRTEKAREEVAALRARVVVLPSVDNVMNIVMRYQWNEKTNVTGTTNWAANLGMKVVDEVKRLNGKAVSEGMLRRLYRDWCKATDTADIANDMEELGALLGEGEGGGRCAKRMN
ncbi:hypothetical protein ACNFH8_28035 [Pseudomonas sp. NY15436]|uniref:hypothetical protein n=1 Tax=Pseudomonas sp. NY15436 TaxID=3400359 RepID=UPI003A8462A8